MSLREKYVRCLTGEGDSDSPATSEVSSNTTSIYLLVTKRIDDQSLTDQSDDVLRKRILLLLSVLCLYLRPRMTDDDDDEGRHVRRVLEYSTYILMYCIYIIYPCQVNIILRIYIYYMVPATGCCVVSDQIVVVRVGRLPRRWPIVRHTAVGTKYCILRRRRRRSVLTGTNCNNMTTSYIIISTTVLIIIIVVVCLLMGLLLTGSKLVWAGLLFARARCISHRIMSRTCHSDPTAAAPSSPCCTPRRVQN